MADVKTDKQVFEKPVVDSIPRIVERNIAAVMVDRTAMRALEADLDKYMLTHHNALSEVQKTEQKEVIRKQLNDGRLALESLMQRFLTS